MFVQNVKIAIRNMMKQKSITILNVAGLAVGMACAILIFLWVDQQLSYDQWQPKKDHIYRLESENWVILPPYLGETVKAFPEVENMVRFYFWYEPTLKYKNNNFTVSDFALVDSTVFDVFAFNFIAGQSGNAFEKPNSLVLTQSIAERLFGDEPALGKQIMLGNRFEYIVTGVVEDVKKFHMDINAFASVTDRTRRDGNDDFLTARNHNFSIYVLAKPSVDIPQLVQKINDRAVSVDKYDSSSKLILRSYNDIYFANHLKHERNTRHGNMNLVLVFSVISLLILGISCINFINLTVAKTGVREKEIAIRKVVGAGRGALQRQFFGETAVIVAVAFVLAVIFVQLSLPGFRNVTGEAIHFTLSNVRLVLIMTGVLAMTAFTSGFYPSFYLSVLQPVAIFRGKRGKGKKSQSLGKGLIGFQFVISIFLVIVTLTVMNQSRFMRTMDLGINHDQVLTCTLQGDRFRVETDHYLSSKKAFKDRLLKNPSIQGVTYLNQLPGKITNTWTMYVTDEDNQIPIRVINADPDFIPNMNVDMIDGRNLSWDLRTDLGKNYILNEEAVRQLALDQAVGSTLNGGRSEVIGVVKNFHYNSPHTQIEPMAITWNSWTRRACIKIVGQDIPGAIAHIQSVYNQFCPGFAFEYDFMDKAFARQYAAERRLEDILAFFVGLAISLSCLGLFAMTAFVAEQKTKEIGIRKVLGSSRFGIVKLLANSFTRWVLLANLVAWPLAYFVLHGWLQDFAYHIDLGITIFLIGGALGLCVALLTVSLQAFKAATVNPVVSLRSE